MSRPRVYLSRIKKKSLLAVYQLSDLISGGDKHVRYQYYNNGYHNPNYRFSKDEITFLHIPKTGGSSMAKMLEKDPQNRFVHLNIHKPVSRECLPQDYRYITVIRNPVDRVWSYYQMVLRSPKGYPYLNYAEAGLDVFLRKCWAARNLACRYLSGEVEPEPNAATLDKALANLDQFYAVLSFENFGRDVSAFLDEHGISHDELPNERKAQYVKPTAEERELIARFNQFDVALFEAWGKSN